MQLVEFVGKLTKESLYEIAITSDAPLDLRYEAARELQSRRLSGEMITDIVRLYPFRSSKWIAEYLGIPRSTVVNTARRLGLPKKAVNE